MRVAKSLENAKPEIPSIRDRHFAVVRGIAWSSSFVTQKKGVTENERQKVRVQGRSRRPKGMLKRMRKKRKRKMDVWHYSNFTVNVGEIGRQQLDLARKGLSKKNLNSNEKCDLKSVPTRHYLQPFFYFFVKRGHRC